MEQNDPMKKIITLSNMNSMRNMDRMNKMN